MHLYMKLVMEILEGVQINCSECGKLLKRTHAEINEHGTTRMVIKPCAYCPPSDPVAPDGKTLILTTDCPGCKGRDGEIERLKFEKGYSEAHIRVNAVKRGLQENAELHGKLKAAEANLDTVMAALYTLGSPPGSKWFQIAEWIRNDLIARKDSAAMFEQILDILKKGS